MSDLRDRIAAAIADALAVEASIAGEFCNRYVAVDGDGDEQGDELLRLDCSVNPRHVADAVIAALNLEVAVLYKGEIAVEGFWRTDE